MLALNNVRKKYGEKVVLHPVSLELASGDCLTVLGPNGAGKSTLLKILSQQTKSSAGNIFYSGTDIKKLGSDYRKKIGVISHNPFLYEGLTGYENLVFYGRLYGVPEPEKRAKFLLSKVEMTRNQHDPVRTYSRGMLQRTSIARALLQEPEVVFLDEPYTGLDKQASYVLTDILKEQIAHNTTLVLVTHDLLLGRQLASKILILARGKVSFYGDKEETPLDKFEEFYLDKVEQVSNA